MEFELEVCMGIGLGKWVVFVTGIGSWSGMRSGIKIEIEI